MSIHSSSRCRNKSAAKLFSTQRGNFVLDDCSHYISACRRRCSLFMRLIPSASSMDWRHSGCDTQRQLNEILNAQTKHYQRGHSLHQSAVSDGFKVSIFLFSEKCCSDSRDDFRGDFREILLVLKDMWFLRDFSVKMIIQKCHLIQYCLVQGTIQVKMLPDSRKIFI